MNYRLNKKQILVSLIFVFLASFTLLSLYSQENTRTSPYRDPETLQQLIGTKDIPYLLLDVRTPGEFDSGYIPTAENLPLQIIGDKLPQVPKDSLVILYCRSGNRSAQAKRILENEGYTNIVDFGGINRWPFEIIR